MSAQTAWWAEGLLLESCNCRLLCRCHIAYRQPADHERCVGYIAVRVEDGAYGEVPLGGLDALVLIDAPRIMTEPDWTIGLCISERARPPQHEALERILSGQAGGGWAVLGALAARRLATRSLPIRLEAERGGWALRVEGLLQSTLEPTRGADKAGPIRLENTFNQVHGPTQSLAWGSTRFDAALGYAPSEQTHALWSRFRWRVG
jgi:hypothetical protein